MAIARKLPLFQSILLASTISLVACGGGGGGGGGNGGSSSSAAPDTTPNAFTFISAEKAEVSTVVTSPAVTIAGINSATQISITGGEYSINGGAFTSNAGTISNGQTLTVRTTASDKTNTPKEIIVTVGGVSAKFVVTTLADTTPDAFSFTAKTDVAVNTEETSEIVTIKGIDIAVPVSITGGLYSINGGEFTSAAGTISAGQTITVKATAANISDTTQNAVLTIGGISSTFAVTTIPDTAPPIAEFKFPTPYTMSEANSVKVRGTATDDHAITSVKVVVRSYNLDAPTVTLSTETIDVTPKAVGDYSSWTADIPLTALAENEVKVIAMDDRDNSTQLAEANKVVIRQADVASAFPDEVNQFSESEYSALDVQRNRVLISDRGNVSAVDLSTGKRTVFVDHESICSSILAGLTLDVQGSRLYGICSQAIVEFNLLDGTFINQFPITPNSPNFFRGPALDRLNGRNRLVLIERVSAYSEEGGRVFGFSLDSKEFSVISDASEQPLIKGSSGISVDGDDYLVTSGGQHEDPALRKVIKVNAITGRREVFADNSIGSGELFSSQQPDGNVATLSGTVKDTKYNRLIVMEDLASRLLAIDLNTRERSLFKDISYGGITNLGVSSADLDLNEINGYLLIPDSRRIALIMVDVETREKVIVSKSKNNF